MHVDQKNVTAICLRDGRTRDIVLRKDAWGYQVSLVSKDDVVNIQMSAQDLQKLGQEIAKWTARDAKKESQPMPVQQQPIPIMADSSALAWSTLDWMSFN